MQDKRKFWRNINFWVIMFLLNNAMFTTGRSKWLQVYFVAHDACLIFNLHIKALIVYFINITYVKSKVTGVFFWILRQHLIERNLNGCLHTLLIKMIKILTTCWFRQKCTSSQRHLLESISQTVRNFSLYVNVDIVGSKFKAFFLR